MSAPSAARNIAPILQALGAHVPSGGRALEIASGTGEHVLAFAHRFPDVEWHPSDIAADRLASIEAWRASNPAPNLHPARYLDATGPQADLEGFDLLIIVNLLHLVPAEGAQRIIETVARALSVGGRFFLYGPFRVDGQFRGAGDAAFHARLRESDPAIGYKDLEWVTQTCAQAGLEQVDLIEMPANNLTFVARRL